MRKRRLLVWAGGLAFVAVVAWYVVLATRPKYNPSVTPENFYRLRLGMTQQEAEAILGEPWEEGEWESLGRHVYWRGEQVSVSVGFCDELASGYLYYRDTGEGEYLPNRWKGSTRPKPD
jgi:hypothetical protein